MVGVDWVGGCGYGCGDGVGWFVEFCGFDGFVFGVLYWFCVGVGLCFGCGVDWGDFDDCC